MKSMEYKGLTGSVSWSETDQVLFDEIENIVPTVSYEALVPSELRVAFEEAVDDYFKHKREEKV